MDKLEKVIQAFENCTDPEMNDDNETVADCIRAGVCPWDDCQERGCKLIDIPLSLAMATLELLKAQEPRVMTLEEASCRIGEPVWVEEKAPDAVYCEVLFDVDGKAFKLTSGSIEFGGLLTGHSLFSVEPYGRDFRFWTARPTDEQREAVKWDAAH